MQIGTYFSLCLFLHIKKYTVLQGFLTTKVKPHEEWGYGLRLGAPGLQFINRVIVRYIDS